MSNLLRHATRAIALVFAVGAGLSMFAVFAIIFVNSFRRYMFGRSLQWGEELPIYLTIYGVMFGSALAYLHDRHVRFTLVTDLVSDGTRRFLFLAVDAIMVGTGLLMAYSGYLFATQRGAVDASGIRATARGLAETTGLPFLAGLGQLYPYQLAIAIGGAMIAIAALLKFFQRLSDPLSGATRLAAQAAQGSEAQ